MKTVRIRLLWQAQAQFAGYLVAQEQGLARGHGFEIACEPIDFSDPGMSALAASRVEFAVASPSHMLESAHADELALVLAVQQKSPLVYPARRSDGITAFADLKFRSVAVWPGGEDLELRWAMHRATGDAHAAKHLPNPTTVTPFLAGEVASAQVTDYHELHQVKATIDPQDLVCLRAEMVGADLIKDGLITRRNWLTENPEAAHAVVEAVLEGWTRAFEDPEMAVELCARWRPDMERTEHARQLANIRTLATTRATLTNGLGYPDPVHDERVLLALREVGDAVPAGAVEAFVDDRFWRAAPARWKRSAWP